MVEWRRIENYPSYEVSDDGFVRGKRGKLNPFPDKQGYSQVKLSNIEGRKNQKVHRLVATAFIPNPLNLSDVNHKDGKKSRNPVDNLEWSTRSDNLLHRSRVLGVGVGEKHHHSKLTTQQVLIIRESIESPKILAARFGIHKTHVYRIKRKEQRFLG